MDELYVEMEAMRCECCEKTSLSVEKFVNEIKKDVDAVGLNLYHVQTLTIRFLHLLSVHGINKFASSESDMNQFETLLKNIKQINQSIWNLAKRIRHKREALKCNLN